jgi:lysophospholipid acyltransferase (LPLAT)-like uncharacterized protein
LTIFILKAIIFTCKVRYINKKYIDEFIFGDKKLVVSAWHRCSIYFLLKYGSFHPMVLISPSEDGNLLVDFAKKLGAIPVRGSSTRGGRKGSRQMVEFLNSGGRAVATVADGPRGPALRAKPGLVKVCQKTGVQLMPITWSADRVWVFRKAWDKTIIPKPFSNIIISASEPFLVPREAKGKAFDYYVKKMEKTLNSMTLEVDNIAGHHDPNLDKIAREDNLNL